MRKITCVFLLSAALVSAPVPVGSAGDDFKLEPGFMLLFNGKNFDGWQPKGKKTPLTGKTDIGRFKVEDGTVHFNSAKKGESYIETTKQFAGDVTVKFDFKPGPKCNNDFFVRNIKFDIVPDAKADSAAGKENKAVKKDSWNTMEIIAKGDVVEFKINGELARTKKQKAVPSPFIMRAEIGEITVKNIRVKE